ncbi:MAG: DUF4430 domain-containing protein [Lachnospiraceae bacterium]|nr:DUF4430 domain-containing protein [Candidatus Equihabitans merdae]
MRDGSGSILVLAGTVIYEKDGETYTAKAGEQISILENDISVTKLDATALNEFAITQAKNAKETLCFTADDLDKVLADREAERQAALETSETIHIGDEANADSTEADADSTGKDKDKNSSAAEAEEEDDDDKGGSGGSSSGETSGPVNTCTIQIRCDTILNNLENLEPSKAGYVPGNGVILTPCTVEFEEGETVFDVLCRVCNYFGIQIEYSWTPIYNSYYIEGINNLYEFDCGNQSGWMYKVNGWFPNYGCSSYTLKNGDNIVWCYTCNGLGADVGASMG